MTSLPRRWGAGVPVYSPFYFATEGLMGFNQDAASKDGSSPTYVLHPKTMFFEFEPVAPSLNGPLSAVINESLPVSKSLNKTPQPVLLGHQVAVGQSYNLLVTTVDGLCRWRVNDVVEVRVILIATSMFILIILTLIRSRVSEENRP
jgi:hypothetical protein